MISAVDATTRRLRCIGYIINLSARALLDASGSELAVASKELDIEEEVRERAAATWQATGSLGKLHRLVKYILASPQRREEFGIIKGHRKEKEVDHLGISPFSSNCARWIIDFGISLLTTPPHKKRWYRPIFSAV